MEKLTYEDALMVENLVNKINELVDNSNELEEHYNKRINNLYKFIRQIKDKENKANGN